MLHALVDTLRCHWRKLTALTPSPARLVFKYRKKAYKIITTIAKKHICKGVCVRSCRVISAFSSFYICHFNNPYQLCFVGFCFFFCGFIVCLLYCVEVFRILHAVYQFFSHLPQTNDKRRTNLFVILNFKFITDDSNTEENNSAVVMGNNKCAYKWDTQKSRRNEMLKCSKAKRVFNFDKWFLRLKVCGMQHTNKIFISTHKHKHTHAIFSQKPAHKFKRRRQFTQQ